MEEYEANLNSKSKRNPTGTNKYEIKYCSNEEITSTEETENSWEADLGTPSDHNIFETYEEDICNGIIFPIPTKKKSPFNTLVSKPVSRSTPLHRLVVMKLALHDAKLQAYLGRDEWWKADSVERWIEAEIRHQVKVGANSITM